MFWFTTVKNTVEQILKWLVLQEVPCLRQSEESCTPWFLRPGVSVQLIHKGYFPPAKRNSSETVTAPCSLQYLKWLEAVWMLYNKDSVTVNLFIWQLLWKLCSLSVLFLHGGIDTEKHFILFLYYFELFINIFSSSDQFEDLNTKILISYWFAITFGQRGENKSVCQHFPAYVSVMVLDIGYMDI